MTSCFCRKVWLPVESTSRNTDSSQRVVVQDSSLCCQLASTASKCSPHLTPLLNAAASLLLSGRKHINCNKYSTVHHQSISLLSMSSSFPTTSSSIWWLVEIQTHQTTVGTLLKWPVTLSCVVTFDKYSADRSDSSYILTSPPCCLFLSPILLLTCCVDLFFMDTWAWLYTHGVLSSDTSQQYHTCCLCFSLRDASFLQRGSGSCIHEDHSRCDVEGRAGGEGDPIKRPYPHPAPRQPWVLPRGLCCRQAT